MGLAPGVYFQTSNFVEDSVTARLCTFDFYGYLYYTNDATWLAVVLNHHSEL